MTHPLDRARMRKAFDNQRSAARQRRIAWEMTWEEWRAWWLTDNRWARRGTGVDNLVMSRPRDVGPYALHNIVARTPGENARDVPAETRRAAAAKTLAAKSPEYVVAAAAHARTYLPVGEKHANSKYTAALARSVFLSPLRSNAAARAFGVPLSFVGKVRRRLTWRHATEGLTRPAPGPRVSPWPTRRSVAAASGLPLGRRSENQSSALSEAQVMEIKALTADKQNQRHLASRYGVSRQTISRIATGKVWKHLLMAAASP